MGAYDGAATEQHFKKDLEFYIEYSYFSTPLNHINQQRKTEVGNPLEILESHQSYEYS